MKPSISPGVFANTVDVHALEFMVDGPYRRVAIVGWHIDEDGCVGAITSEGIMFDSDIYCFVERVGDEVVYVWPYDGFDSSLDVAIAKGQQIAKEWNERTKHFPRVGMP